MGVVAETEREIIGDAVQKDRRRAGLSQEALAEKVDIHTNYVGRIEGGERSATVPILLLVARTLAVRPHKLFLKL